MSDTATQAAPQKKRSLVDWVSADRREAVLLLEEARERLELDGRVSARSRATVKRIDSYLSRIEGR